MADQDTQVADAPAPDTSQDTAPTPVREAVGETTGPDSPSKVNRRATEQVMAELEEKYGGGEEPPETDETAAEATEATEGEQAPEVAAEDAVRMDSGPDAADLPEGYQYDEHGRLHDEAGRYVSAQQLEPDEDGAAASGEEVPPSASDDPDAPSVPEGFEQLDLPPGHPLRDRGEEQVPIPSKETLVEQFGERGEQVYNYLRHGLNAGAENRQLRTQFQQLQNQLARLQAEREVEQSEEGQQWDPRDNPQLRQEIEDIRETYGDERAEQYIEALKAKKRQMTEERAQQTLSEKQQQNQAARFVRAVASRANDYYDAWPGVVTINQQTGQLVGHGERYQRVSLALQQFAQLVDANQERPHPRNFFEHLDAIYARDPRARESIEEQLKELEAQQRDEAKQEAKEELKREERERMKEASERRDANPHAKLAGQETGKTTPRPEEEEPDYTGMSPDQVNKDVKRRLFGSG